MDREIKQFFFLCEIWPCNTSNDGSHMFSIIIAKCHLYFFKCTYMYTYTYMHTYKLVYVHVCYNTHLSKFEPTTSWKSCEHLTNKPHKLFKVKMGKFWILNVQWETCRKSNFVMHFLSQNVFKWNKKMHNFKIYSKIYF